MAITTMNQYTGKFYGDSNTIPAHTIIADSMVNAAQVFTDLGIPEDKIPGSITLTTKDVSVYDSTGPKPVTVIIKSIVTSSGDPNPDARKNSAGPVGPMTLLEGTSQYLQAIVDEHYTFEGWSIGGTVFSTELMPEYTVPFGSVEIEIDATFTYKGDIPASVTLTLSSNVDSTGDPLPAEHANSAYPNSPMSISPGSSQYLQAVVNQYYAFMGFFVNGSDTPLEPVSSTVEYTVPESTTGDISIVAKFKYNGGSPTPAAGGTLTLSADDGGASSGCAVYPTGSMTVIGDETQYIQAVPVAGWQFDGWFVNGSSTAISTNAVYAYTVPHEGGSISIVGKFSVST